jgi:hypothetical protein
MSRFAYTSLLLAGVCCIALSGALILLSVENQRMQARVQSQQQLLGSGILGQQGRQIAVNVIQDMTAAAAGNDRIRELLAHYNYPVPEAVAPAAPATPGAVTP